MQKCIQLIRQKYIFAKFKNTLSITKYFCTAKISCLQYNAIHISLPLSLGNWSPSDFPEGDSWSTSGANVNRDLLVVMTDPNVVGDFLDVFNNDWQTGRPWEPKSGIGLWSRAT